MFSERFDQLLQAAGATPAQIAFFMHMDPSNISRMRTGKRQPKYGGKGTWRLVQGVFSYADEKGTLSSLRRTVGCSSMDSAEQVRGQMMEWLFEGTEHRLPEVRAPKDPRPHKEFGERLGAVMEMADLSNIRLGRLINVDSSYISRFRNGLRSPRSNPDTMHALCTVLTERLFEQNKQQALSTMLSISPDEAGDREAVFAALYGWLYDTNPEDRSSSVEQFIETIDAFPAKMLQHNSAESLHIADWTAFEAEPKEVYYGAEGLQQAVVRFLLKAIQEPAKELLLYSDQGMDWMTDPAFQKRWAGLMQACIAQGTKIRIVHTVDRDLGEMIAAIQQWLPLYMSGQIESYYCPKQKNIRFAKSLFLYPGTACIDGSQLKESDASGGIYRYDTEPALLAAQEQAFLQLLSESDRLVQIDTESDGLTRIPAQADGITTMGRTLSLGTMPEAVLRSALARSDAKKEAKEKALSLWKTRRQQLQSQLSCGFVHECMPLAELDALLEGKICMELPGITAKYTPKEYAAHVQAIKELMEKTPGYRIYILPEEPFNHTQLILSKHAVAVSRIMEPRITFFISHPAMCRAFEAYATRLKETYHADTITIGNRLDGYIHRP